MTDLLTHPADAPPFQETDCVIVHLQPSDNTLDNPYRLNREINITRSLIIQGDTFDQPFVDCFDAVRCFRVKARGGGGVVPSVGSWPRFDPLRPSELTAFPFLSHSHRRRAAT